MGGVEIEFSIDGEANTTHVEEDERSENEAGESEAPPNATTGGRIQGKPHSEFISQLLKLTAVPTQIMQLLEHAGFRRIFALHRAGDPGITLELDVEEESGNGGGYRSLRSRRKRRPKDWTSMFPPVPNEEGKKLMDGGVFGRNEYYRDRRSGKPPRLARKLMNRELGTERRQLEATTSEMSQV